MLHYASPIFSLKEFVRKSDDLSKHEDFCRLFQQHFPSSFEAYRQLPNERLFVVRPTFIQRWSYINESPMIERLYLHEKQYHEEAYLNDD